jgi:hypothetical protein
MFCGVDSSKYVLVGWFETSGSTCVDARRMFAIEMEKVRKAVGI